MTSFHLPSSPLPHSFIALQSDHINSVLQNVESESFCLGSIAVVGDTREPRPAILQEQAIGYYTNFFKGCGVGFQSLLSLMGYYEDEDVKANLVSETLDVDAADEEDQTSIQIVGLGLGRTGTTSLAMALEILGYTVIHDDEQPELTDVWDFWEDEDIDIDEVHEILGLRGYNATFKTANYGWVAKQEDVKAILTVRDNADKYVDSWMAAAPFIDILKSAPYKWMPTVEVLLPSLELEYMNETTGGNPELYLDRDSLKENYNAYNSRVQEAIPEERLLTFNLKEGWKPLCEFLDVPVPEGIPFPHVHTRAKLDGEMFFLRMIIWIWPLVLMIPLHVALSLLGRANLYKWALEEANNDGAAATCVVPAPSVDSGEETAAASNTKKKEVTKDEKEFNEPRPSPVRYYRNVLRKKMKSSTSPVKASIRGNKEKAEENPMKSVEDAAPEEREIIEVKTLDHSDDARDS